MENNGTEKKGMMKKWFLPYFRKHTKTLCLDLLCALFTTGCELVLPMIVREITKIATDDISKLTVSVILQMALLFAVLKIIDMLAGCLCLWLSVLSYWNDLIRRNTFFRLL